MTIDGIKEGAKVKDIQGRVGVFLPDVFGLCNRDCVFVEYDGQFGAVVTPIIGLEVVEILTPKTDSQSCGRCLFCGDGSCFRYTEERIGMILSSFVGAMVPRRIYPDCKNEMAKTTSG